MVTMPVHLSIDRPSAKAADRGEKSLIREKDTNVNNVTDPDPKDIEVSSWPLTFYQF